MALQRQLVEALLPNANEEIMGGGGHHGKFAHVAGPDSEKRNKAHVCSIAVAAQAQDGVEVPEAEPGAQRQHPAWMAAPLVLSQLFSMQLRLLESLRRTASRARRSHIANSWSVRFQIFHNRPSARLEIAKSISLDPSQKYSGQKYSGPVLQDLLGPRRQVLCLLQVLQALTPLPRVEAKNAAQQPWPIEVRCPVAWFAGPLQATNSPRTVQARFNLF